MKGHVRHLNLMKKNSQDFKRCDFNRSVKRLDSKCTEIPVSKKIITK